jgi:hypothetical protein
MFNDIGRQQDSNIESKGNACSMPGHCASNGADYPAAMVAGIKSATASTTLHYASPVLAAD